MCALALTPTIGSAAPSLRMCEDVRAHGTSSLILRLEKMRMRPGLVVLVSMTLMASARLLPAQETERRVPLRACISKFYDRQTYGWQSLKNNCTDVTIVVTYCGQVKGGCSEHTLAPGKASSTGYSQREVAEKGEFAIYACLEDGGYPYWMDGRQVGTGPEQAYQCGKPSQKRSSGGSPNLDFSTTPRSTSSSPSGSETVSLVLDSQIRQRDIKAKDNAGRLVDRVIWVDHGSWYCVQMPWNTIGPQVKCVMQNGTTPYAFRRARFR